MRAVLLTLLASLAVLAGCGGEESRPPPPVERMAQDIARSGAQSVIVFVSDDSEEYVATAGTDQPTGAQRFRVGSVTKTFTATIVLQLVEEGALDLGDTLADHLPGVVPKGDEITIRQLLGHRSGLANITEYPAWLERASRSSSIRPIDTLRFAARQPLVFPPGSDWGYSNTNYIALGLVIERVTGHSYARELEERILAAARARRDGAAEDAARRPISTTAARIRTSLGCGRARLERTHDLPASIPPCSRANVLSGESIAEMKQTGDAPPGAPVSGSGFSRSIRVVDASGVTTAASSIMRRSSAPPRTATVLPSSRSTAERLRAHRRT